MMHITKFFEETKTIKLLINLNKIQKLYSIVKSNNLEEVPVHHTGALHCKKSTVNSNVLKVVVTVVSLCFDISHCTCFLSLFMKRVET